MTTSSIQEFSRKYESLAGKVRVVETDAEAIDAIGAILREVNVTCVATAELPVGIRSKLQSYCANENLAFLSPPYSAADLPTAVDRAQAGVSVANYAIAETGTLIEVTNNDASRLISTLPRAHIALVWAENLLPTLNDAAPIVRNAFEQNSSNCVVSFISGPSRSGDIEMKLTLGVHGPEQSYVIVLTNGFPA